MSLALQPRTSAQLVVDRDFGIIFWTKILINAGIWAQTIVVVVLTYRLSGSSALVGLVGAAQLGPQLAFAMASGRLSDRLGPVSMILAGGITCGAGCIALATWLSLAAGARGPQTVTAVLTGALICGIGNTLFAPAFQSIVPMLVTDEELPAALALNFAPTALARTIGPAAGSILISAVSPAAALLFIGLLMWAVTCSVGFVRRPPLDDTATGDYRISTALRFVAKDRRLILLLGAVTMVAAGSEPAITLAPTIASHLADAGVTAGWITTTFGLGGLIGVVLHPLLAHRLDPVVQGSAAMGGLAVALLPVSATTSAAVVTGALVLAGAAMVLASIAFSIAVVERCPKPMLGRVMGLWVIAFAGSRPFAGMILGVVADHGSLRMAVAAASGLTMVVAATVYAKVTPGSSLQRMRSGRGVS